GDERLDDEEAAIEEADASGDVVLEDDGKETYDNAVVKTLQEKAIQMMESEGIQIDKVEHQIALGVFPRVAGLACQVHDATMVKEKFDVLVKYDKDLSGTSRTLERCIPTHWNSDLACLSSHIFFQPVIEQLTGNSINKLQQFRLSERQWELAHEVEVLLLFQTFTKLFSTEEVPLIVDALPELERIQQSLISVKQNTGAADVIHVAGQAALLVLEKFSIFTNDCDVYLIAIVMCPDCKLKWFKDNGCRPSEIRDIKTAVIDYWKKKYAPDGEGEEIEPETPQVFKHS
ncbi:hypothetical protein BDQ17DRAFT_1255722, partial [Cyathus striatus]